MAVIAQRAPARRSGIQSSQMRAGLIFVSPYLLYFLIFQVGALAFAFWFSLQRYDLLALDNPFVGLRNYERLPLNEDFRKALSNTAAYAIVVTILQTIFALIMAVLLDAKIKGQSFFRSAWYTPSIASTVVISMIFLWIYHPTGLLNSLLGLVGIQGDNWLQDTRTALPAIMGLNIWTTAPTFMVVFLAGLQEIPKEIYEAAQVDGAGGVRRFFSMTIPLLRPIIFLVVALGIIGTFQVFDQVSIMTQGGPLKATLTVAYLIYQNVFRDEGQVGVACAMAFTLGIMIYILTILSRRFLDAKIEY
ncbi:MAG: carbohydrate ABC transporter permease [Candidatus Limnocylindria bacterium]